MNKKKCYRDFDRALSAIGSIERWLARAKNAGHISGDKYQETAAYLSRASVYLGFARFRIANIMVSHDNEQ